MITQLTAEEIMNLPKNKTFWYGYIGFRRKLLDVQHFKASKNHFENRDK